MFSKKINKHKKRSPRGRISAFHPFGNRQKAALKITKLLFSDLPFAVENETIDNEQFFKDLG